MTVTKHKSSTESTRVLSTLQPTVEPVIGHHIDKQLLSSNDRLSTKFTDNKILSKEENFFLTAKTFDTSESNDKNSTVIASQSSRGIDANVLVPFCDQSLLNKESPVRVNIIEDDMNNNNNKNVSKKCEEQHIMSDSYGSQAISRPNTLFTSQLLVNSANPPEFSISPAETLSKASSSDNIFESSINSTFQVNQQKPPHSPTSLSVNFNGGNNLSHCSVPMGTLALSPSFNSLHGSLASSINDLTIEAEQLERAIRHNDTRFVRRMLELHHNRYNVNNLHNNESILDKVSHGSHRSQSQECDNFNKSLLKSQSMIDRFVSNANERRESGSTDERGRESPSIFTNSLHLAIENNSFDVTLLLLRHGIDANEAGVVPYSSDPWRRSSHTSDESCAPINTNNDRLTINNLSLINSTSREPLIRTPSIRSTNSPKLLSPLAGPSTHLSGVSLNAGHSIYFALNSSPSSINSDLSSICRFSTPTKVIRLRADMWPTRKVVHFTTDGNPVNYDEEYTRENLYSLPPIFLCVALNNSAILRELIKYGANVNISDRYGTTPLHMCLCQEHISRSCLQLLIQNGAKLYNKNKQSIAPFHLVNNDISEQLRQLQSNLISVAFKQIVPKQSIPNNNINNTIINSNNITNNSNSNNNLITTNNTISSPRVYSITNDYDICSTSSGNNNSNHIPICATNNSKISSDIKTNTNNISSGIKKKLKISSKNNNILHKQKDIYICFDKVSVKSSDGQTTHDSIHDSIQSEAFGGSLSDYKRSIAEDSIAQSFAAQEEDIAFVSYIFFISVLVIFTFNNFQVFEIFTFISRTTYREIHNNYWFY
jgi:hypothetical protein